MAVKNIVDRFGGQTALAREFGKRGSTVAYWVRENRIPSKWHGPLLELAEKKGINLTPADLVDRPHSPEVTPKRPAGLYSCLLYTSPSPRDS